MLIYLVELEVEVLLCATGLQIFFQDWWAKVTHGAKSGGSFSEIMGPSISN